MFSLTKRFKVRLLHMYKKDSTMMKIVEFFEFFEFSRGVFRDFYAEINIVVEQPFYEYIVCF